MMRIFKINTNVTPMELNSLEKGLSKSDRNFIKDIEVYAFDVIEDGKVTQYTFSDDLNLEKVFHLLQTSKIKYSVSDISKMAIMGQIIVPDEMFTSQLNRWVNENLTVDDVLDKISMYGVESLTELDREVLKSL